MTLMAQIVIHEKEYLIMHHQLCQHLQLLVISYNFLISILISTFQRHTQWSLLQFSSRTLSTISCDLLPKMPLITVTHSWFPDVRSTSQKLIFSLMKEQHHKILSEIRTSRKLTRSLPPLIRLYWEKCLSTGSICSLAVIT